MAASGTAWVRSDERPKETSVLVRISGRFCMPNKRDENGNLRQFACRMVNVSQTAMILASPVSGRIGERVIAYFEEFGNIHGSILKMMECGFSIQILASQKDRSKLLRKIIWLQQNKDHDVPDARAYKRVIPHDPISTLIFPDASSMRCFIIDMSASGAAISADITPRIGTILAVGKVPGKVVRHFDEGFAVQFNALQEHQSLEKLVIFRY
jgi:hypothetical protein